MTVGEGGGVEVYANPAFVLVYGLLLLISLGGGGLALRWILKGDLMTKRSHDEHMQGAQDEIDRLTREKEADRVAHLATVDRIRSDYQARVDDAVQSSKRSEAQAERWMTAYHITADDLSKITAARSRAKDAQLATMTAILSASPLGDQVRLAIQPGAEPAVGSDDDDQTG